MRWAVVETPIGAVALGADGGGVRAVRLRHTGAVPAGDDQPGGSPAPAEALLVEAAAQLRAYFAGERTGFEVPWTLPAGRGSDFERAVWAELAGIPYGEQRTYGEVAAAVGEPGAARAVGTACNRNPLPLLVPCHRVVGAGGKLVGFGGGLPSKRWLLEHEARVALERAWAPTPD